MGDTVRGSGAPKSDSSQATNNLVPKQGKEHDSWCYWTHFQLRKVEFQAWWAVSGRMDRGEEEGERRLGDVVGL